MARGLQIVELGPAFDYLKDLSSLFDNQQRNLLSSIGVVISTPGTSQNPSINARYSEDRLIETSQSCPRVGWTRESGRVGSRIWRILAGRVSTSDFVIFY